MPIHVFADAEDYLLRYEACPRIVSLQEQTVNSAAFSELVKNSSSEIISKLEEAMGSNLTVNEAYDITDQLAARYFDLGDMGAFSSIFSKEEQRNAFEAFRFAYLNNSLGTPEILQLFIPSTVEYLQSYMDMAMTQDQTEGFSAYEKMRFLYLAGNEYTVFLVAKAFGV